MSKRSPRREPREPGTSALQRATKAAALGAEVTGGYLAFLAQSLFLDDESRHAKLETTHRKTARRLTDGMLELRGPLMKLGQTLSMSGDVLPAETLAELSQLQRGAPGMHPSLVRAQFRASMQCDPEEVFAEFDPTPFAAASLGQVHRARLKSGETVAVKIQYPGIRDVIEADFKWFRTVALPARVSKHLPTSIIDEMQEQIRAEADYTREATNTEVFAKELVPLGFVEVPRVHRAYSTDRVLTMSLVPGEHLDTFLAARPSQQLRDLVGARLFESFYFQVLRMKTLHADPHWGNYLFRGDGTIGLVDFGCVKYLPADFVAGYRKTFLHGRYDSDDFRRLVKELYTASGAPPTPATLRALVSIAVRFYGKVYPTGADADARAFDFSDADFLREYMQETLGIARAKGMRTEYVFLARAEVGLYQTLHRLGARVHTSRLVRKHLRSATDD